MLRIINKLNLRSFSLVCAGFFVILSTTAYGASSSTYTKLYHSNKYYSLISQIYKDRESKDNSFSYIQLYLLYISFLKTGQTTKADSVFNLIQSSPSHVLRDFTNNETMTYLYTTRSYTKLVELFHQVLTQDNVFLKERVLVLLYQSFKNYRNKTQLSKVLRWFFLYHPEFNSNHRLVQLYLESLSKDSDEYGAVLLRYWIVTPHRKFATKYRAELKNLKLYKTQDVYVQGIISHMKNQLRYKEYTYIQKYIPQYLDKLPNMSDQQAKQLQAIFFQSFVYKSHWYKMLRLFSHKKQYNMFRLNSGEVLAWQTYAYLKLNSISHAERLIRLLESKGYKSLNQHYHLLALYWLSKKDYSKAQAYLKKITDVKELSLNQLADNNWHLFQIYKNAGRAKDMSNIIEWAEAQDFKYSANGARFCYWANQYSLGSRNNEECYKQYPYNYYGIISKYRIDSNGLLLNSPRWKWNIDEIPSLTKEQTKELQFISFIYQIHGNKTVDKFITWRLVMRQGTGYFIALCKILARKQNYYRLYYIATTLFTGNATIYAASKKDKKINQLRRTALYYSYPKAYFKLIQKYAKKENISPFFVLALIRSESNFRYYVHSSVGAIGLMQLMMPTARDIARRMQISITRRKLLDPETNIRFGIYYIHTLLRYYKGNLYYAIAAYNGGFGNVRKWRRSKEAQLSNNAFIETIYFNETRNYVKNVLKNYYIYQFLYE